MSDRLAPVFDLAELQEIFGYRNRRMLTHAIRAGTFPVKTFEMGHRRIVAHVDVVKKYFADEKNKGLSDLDPDAKTVEVSDDWDR